MEKKICSDEDVLKMIQIAKKLLVFRTQVDIDLKPRMETLSQDQVNELESAQIDLKEAYIKIERVMFSMIGK